MFCADYIDRRERTGAREKKTGTLLKGQMGSNGVSNSGEGTEMLRGALATTQMHGILVPSHMETLMECEGERLSSDRISRSDSGIP